MAVWALPTAVMILPPARAQDPGDNGVPPPPALAAPDSTIPGGQPAPTANDLGAGSPTGPGPVPAVNFQTFYDSLATEGNWIQTPQFGYVWQPNVSDPQWAPYTNGHWVYTDAGWTWDSNEPWGWATYHYGRWANLDGQGWCWVPGYTWAPAWVSWRYGDGYVGWAPLPPDSLVGVDYDADPDGGFHIGGDSDSYYDVGPEWYSFLPVIYLGEGDYGRYYADRHRNFGIINHTTNVTNLNVTRTGAGTNAFTGASLGGPSIRQVNSQSQTPVPTANLAFTNRVGGGVVSHGSFSIFAPRVQAAAGTIRPAAQVQALNAVTVNRGTSLAQPMMVTAHVASATATPEEVRQARTAQGQAPFDARVATPGTTAPALAQPIVSLHPNSFSTAPGQPVPGTFNGGFYQPAPSYSSGRFGTGTPAFHGSGTVPSFGHGGVTHGGGGVSGGGARGGAVPAGPGH